MLQGARKGPDLQITSCVSFDGGGSQLLPCWPVDSRASRPAGSGSVMSVTPESSVVGIQPADAAQASMIDQVVAAIEPVTRFDRSSLVVHPGRVFEIDALATACATVRFDTVSREHPGEAPREAKRFGSHSDMEDASEFALETAHAQLRERLTEWLRSIREERPPSPAECYHGPTVFAHTFQCAECAGKGRTTCSACSGGGRIRCHYCGGAGSVTCNNCHGGYVACLTCGGRGGALVAIVREATRGGMAARAARPLVKSDARDVAGRPA
jgi:hypothetical protein